jgi:hypothetical protein
MTYENALAKCDAEAARTGETWIVYAHIDRNADNGYGYDAMPQSGKPPRGYKGMVAQSLPLRVEA